MSDFLKKMATHSQLPLSVDGTVHHNPQEKILYQSEVNVMRQEDASQSHHSEQEVGYGNVVGHHGRGMAKTDWTYRADNQKGSGSKDHVKEIMF